MAKEKSPTPKKQLPPKPQTIDQLIPWEENVNKGTERGSGLIEDSLRKLGAGRSLVVDRNNKLICGNQTHMGAVNAGLLRVITVDTTGNEVVVVRRTDLDLDKDARARALAIADNAISLRSIDLDGVAIAQQAEEYDIDLNALGISPGELQGLLEDAQSEDEPREPKGKKPVVCPHCGESFTPKK